MEQKELWQSVLGELEIKISRPNFLTWIKNSNLVEKNDDGLVIVGLPNNFAREWVSAKYNKVILETLRSLDISIRRIEYVVFNNGMSLIKSDLGKVVFRKQPVLPEFKIDQESNLNPKYTLKTFVVGSSNELCYAACSAVINDVGKKYNPLFIYGGVGLGKTHLLQAAGNEIKEKYFNKVKVKYVPSEKFVSDVVWSIKNKRMDDMKAKYRNTDVLVVDDIQFIGGKERSEEEFFHTFNALYETGKQIIISSDRQPAAIPTLENRLRSRFEGGMIVDITYPDYEMRLAIIKTKLQEKNVYLPDDVSEFIAQKVQRNIREIEGILNKVLFYREVKNIEPSVKLVEETINESLKGSAKNITSSQIIKAVADFFEILPNDFINRSRKKGVVELRQIAAFLLREILSLSYPEIGEKLGNRDHSTIIYSCAKISNEINKNNVLNQKVLLIKELIYKNN